MLNVDTQELDICLVVMDFKDLVLIGLYGSIINGCVWASLFKERGWDSRGEAMTATSQPKPVVRHELVSAPEPERVALSSTECQWYALQTQSRHEKQVRD